MSISLRPYQLKLQDEARALMHKGCQRILLQGPTGMGKTALCASMMGRSAERGNPSWFIVHRRELLSQSQRAFEKAGFPYGLIAAGFHPNPDPLVQICSIGSLGRRLSSVRKPRLIIWDECHHVAAASWKKIFDVFPDAFHIGLTATPQRLDGKGLSDFFQAMILGPTVAELIEQKYLSKYKLFAPPGISVAGVKMQYGDFSRREIVDIVNRPTITGNAIVEYRRQANGKRAVAFCASVEHSKHVAQQFSDAGIPAWHVDGETPTPERDAAINSFVSGKTLVLTNVDLFGEGFDVPAIECVIDLAPTQSLAKFLQRCGRALRPADGKDVAIILDHAGNVNIHGMPDENREWTLQGKLKGHGSVRICPECFAAQPSSNKKCENEDCGFVFPVVSRYGDDEGPREVEQVPGDLVEVQAAALKHRHNKENRGAKTVEELTELGRRRGYKRPELWARHYFEASRALKYRRTG